MAQTPSRYLDFANTIWIPTQDQPPVFSAITDLQPNLPLGAVGCAGSALALM